VIIETLTRDGEKSVMAQRYIPEIREGDKRILLIAGRPCRIASRASRSPARRAATSPPAATGVAKPLSRATWKSRTRSGRSSRERACSSVGLDVIGDYLTEINVTSPTCFQEITQQTDSASPGCFLDALEAACQADCLRSYVNVAHGVQRQSPE